VNRSIRRVLRENTAWIAAISAEGWSVHVCPSWEAEGGLRVAPCSLARSIGQGRRRRARARAFPRPEPLGTPYGYPVGPL
jgi:hypothetical protein